MFVRTVIKTICIIAMTTSIASALPDKFDWRDWGVMTPAKFQGLCGSCWAFTAVGVVEAQYKKLCDWSGDVDLSEENLVAEGGDCYSADCAGGNHGGALGYIRDNGISDEDCFPYVDVNCPVTCGENPCIYGCSDAHCDDKCYGYDDRLWYIHGVSSVDDPVPDRASIEVVKEYIFNHGPVGAALCMLDPNCYIEDERPFIYRCDPAGGRDHTVILTGWDETSPDPNLHYWIAKNSWGTHYREGYWRITYGDVFGDCNIGDLRGVYLYDDDCFPTCHPDYGKWVYVDEPECWCYDRQCHGDADGQCQGKQCYWVSTNDLDILLAAWNKPLEQLSGDEICADFDHQAQGKQRYRVSTDDLDILMSYWHIPDGPDPDCFDGYSRGEKAGGAPAGRRYTIEEMIVWLEELWLDPEIRKAIDEDSWIRVIESLMKELKTE
jgi:C1A family cysteine protease